MGHLFQRFEPLQRELWRPHLAQRNETDTKQLEQRSRFGLKGAVGLDSEEFGVLHITELKVSLTLLLEGMQRRV